MRSCGKQSNVFDKSINKTWLPQKNKLYHTCRPGTRSTDESSIDLLTLFWCWVSLCAPLTVFLIEFYFIIVFNTIIVTTLAFLWPIFSFWTTRLGFLWLSSFVSAEAQFLDASIPVSMNIGLNILPSDSLMSCLHSFLGYSTEFQALQLIVHAAFGAVD